MPNRVFRQPAAQRRVVIPLAAEDEAGVVVGIIPPLPIIPERLVRVSMDRLVILVELRVRDAPRGVELAIFIQCLIRVGGA